MSVIVEAVTNPCTVRSSHLRSTAAEVSWSSPSRVSTSSTMFVSIINLISGKPLLSEGMPVDTRRDFACQNTGDGVNRRNIWIDQFCDCLSVFGNPDVLVLYELQVFA